jgi:hypothetical protein
MKTSPLAVLTSKPIWIAGSHVAMLLLGYMLLKENQTTEAQSDEQIANTSVSASSSSRSRTRSDNGDGVLLLEAFLAEKKDAVDLYEEYKKSLSPAADKKQALFYAMDEVAEYLKYNTLEIRDDVIEMVSGQEIDIIIKEEFRAGQDSPKTKKEIYSAMIILGFLSYYDGYLKIPNKELLQEFEKAAKLRDEIAELEIVAVFVNITAVHIDKPHLGIRFKRIFRVGQTVWH